MKAATTILEKEIKTLMPFQNDGVQVMMNFLVNNGATYNADEQGLGKTIQTAEVINNFYEAGFVSPALIICPKVMLYTWEKELSEWLRYPLNVKLFDKTAKLTKENIKDADIVLTSYDVARIKEEVLGLAPKQKEKFWKLLVLDEAHYLKNHRAKRTKSILEKIWTNFVYKIALSGTPLRQNVIDAYTMFKVMAPDVFPSFQEFAARYSYARATPYAIQYHGIRNAPELKQIIRSRFYFRRTKQEVLKELPNKIFQKITLGPEYQTTTPKTEKEKLEQEIFAITQKLKEGGMTTVMNTTMAGERRIQGEIKAPAVAAFAEDLLEQGIPVVIGAYHKNVIAILSRELVKYKPVVITGETPAKLRSQYVENFQKGKTDLFIGQFTAAGVGITLTRAANMILAEPSYDPAELSQFIARCHRIGQEEILTVYYFMVDGGIDNEMVEIVMRKMEEFVQVVEN